MPPALVLCGSQGLENRTQSLHDLLFTAYHQRKTLSKAPYAPAGTDVNQVKAAALDRLGPPESVFVVGIPSVQEHITLTKKGQKGLDELVHWGTRRDHQPNRPRLTQLLDQGLNGLGS